MSERIHDDEPDTSEPVVRELLATQCPLWADRPVEYLATSGTDNAMWRIRAARGPDAVARLPRRPGAAAGVDHEVAVLRHLDGEIGQTGIASPVVLHAGQPHPSFGHRWSVLEWIDGADAWTGRDALSHSGWDALAVDLATAVVAIGDTNAAPVKSRSSGDRGGPLGPLIERLIGWLDDPELNASGLIDVAGVRRLADEAAELVDEAVQQGFVHGDLIPGNLLVDGGRLAAVIDWGGAGWGDLAQDLAPAWALLPPSARPTFREIVGGDEATWIRGRTFELEHAVGSFLYYQPRRHPLAYVMAATLDRILTHP